MAVWPLSSAMRRAVRPSARRRSVRAPARKSCLTRSREPALQTMCRGLIPPLSFSWSVAAWAASSNCTQSLWPLKQAVHEAVCKGAVPLWFGWSIAAWAASSSYTQSLQPCWLAAHRGVVPSFSGWSMAAWAGRLLGLYPSAPGGTAPKAHLDTVLNKPVIPPETPRTTHPTPRTPVPRLTQHGSADIEAVQRQPRGLKRRGVRDRTRLRLLLNLRLRGLGPSARGLGGFGGVDGLRRGLVLRASSLGNRRRRPGWEEGDGVLLRLPAVRCSWRGLRRPKERSRARDPPGPVRLPHCLWGGDGGGEGKWQVAARCVPCRPRPKRRPTFATQRRRIV
eukprot:scaffold59458_cov64-Phaeocystis_antarctica.AAC.5